MLPQRKGHMCWLDGEPYQSHQVFVGYKTLDAANAWIAANSYIQLEGRILNVLPHVGPVDQYELSVSVTARLLDFGESNV